MAFSAYRMVYASVWDFRFNHVPLTRHTAFSYGAGAPGAGGFDTAIWTHKAGWGHEGGVFGGAPFDSAGGMGGAGGGLGGGNGVGYGNGHHSRRESMGTARRSVDRRPVPGAHVRGDNIV